MKTFKRNILATFTTLVLVSLTAHAQDQKQDPQQATYLFDYAVKNPKYNDSMPYDTIHGVIAQGNKIIVPAEYADIATRQNEGKIEILAFNKYSQGDDVIRRFDITGKPLPDLPNAHNFIGDGAYVPPRYIVTVLPPNWSEAEKEKILTELDQKLAEQAKSLNDDQIRDLAQDMMAKLDIEYGYLLDTKTGEKVALKDKDILRVNRDFTPNEILNQKFPAQSQSNHKWGYINPKAEWVIPPTYEGINEHNAGEDIPKLYTINNPDILSVYRIGREDKDYWGCQGLLNSQGKPTNAKFEHMGSFANGYAIVRPCGKETQAYKAEGKEILPFAVNGLIDNKGDWVIKPNPNLTILTTPDTQGNFFVKTLKPEGKDQDEREGVMNVKGEWVIPAKYIFPNHNLKGNSSEKITDTLFDSQGLVAVLPKPDSITYGFMNKSGQWQIPPTLVTTFTPRKGRDNWRSNNSNSYRFDTHGYAYGLWDKKCPDCRAVFNTKGERVLPQLEGYIGNFNPQGYAPFVAKGTNVMQVIDKTGKAVTEPKFKNTIRFLYPYNTFSLADEKTKAQGRKNFNQRFSEDSHSPIGLMNDKGDIILPHEYQEIDPAEDDKASYAIVKTREGKYGVIDFNKNWIIQPQAHPLKSIGAGIVLKNLEANAGL